MDIKINYSPNGKQALFHKCPAEEVVYGGAKGGGKSCGLVMEALAYALENPGAEMYIFRETYDDLEANIIKEWKEKVPKELYSYNESKHVAFLVNGTVLKFRFIRNFADAESYQGRSMDWIGVDELTKHEERSIQVLLSCLRSAKGYKPKFRGTCNPGGIGHVWVKDRYIDPTLHGKKIVTDNVTGNRIAFIPATVYDNITLLKNDPAYVKRLENLPTPQKEAYLHGNWDLTEGGFFGSFKRNIHVIEPIKLDREWKRYLTIDYGLDMLAALWIAVDFTGCAYVYREVYKSGLIISEAADAIKSAEDENESIYMRFAPPDLWNRRQETGKSAIDIFTENGLYFTKSSNDRADGWFSVQEWLKVYDDEQGIKTAKLKIFDCCPNIIRTIPLLQIDRKKINDILTEPHELTHAPDALRGFCVMYKKAPRQEIHNVCYDGFLDYGT